MTPRSRNFTSRVSLLGAGIGVALAALAPVGAASAAVAQGPGCTGSPGAVACEFYAVDGTLAVPGGSVAVMGYSDSETGPPLLPGPSIVANVGDVVTVKLHNALTAPAQPTGMLFQEQVMAPDTTGIPAGDASAFTTYTFTASHAGTYLYEASPFVTTTGGGGSQYQAAMGMSGALVVRPAAAGQAYADPGTAFDAEHLVVLNELDKGLTAANAATFDMRDYTPDYYLINGKASPDATDLPASPGDAVLLRYVNAGIKAHSMGLLGLEEQRVVGEDGNALDNPRRMVAETLGAGQTDDVIVDLPADASGRYPVYDAGMAMNNNTASGMGGMLTFLSAGPPAGSTLPVTSNVRVTGANLSADVSGGATQARYFIDSVTGAGTDMGTPAGATFTASVAALTGAHTLYVQGSVDGTTWGPVSSVIYANADITGPVTKSLSLSPNPSNGSAAVLLKATGDDSLSGGAAISAGHYTIDGPVLSPADLAALATTNMIPNGATPVAALDTTIPAATLGPLAAGDHVVRVYSRDAAGNWGAPASITLSKDVTGPAASGPAPSATPPATNGTQVFSTSVPAVRVTFTATDTTSTIAAGEGFIDTVGQDGRGFPLVPTDGAFNGTTEKLQADIPIATITALPQGTHRIYLHARDASGNWGSAAGTSTTILFDKTAPTFTGITLTPNSFLSGTAGITLTVNGAADNAGGAGVSGGEYWINPPTTTAPAPGAGTQFTGTTATIPVAALAAGSHTVSVRMRDAAGNWSSGANGVRTATLTVIPDPIFSNGFETGNAGSNWGWSSKSTTTTSRLNVATGAAALVGTRGLQAQGNNTNYVQFNFGTAANPASGTFDARFYFNPDNNASTGQDILAGATSTTFGTQLLHVRYRRNGTQPQVQIQVGSTANGTWTNITNNAVNRIEIVWQSGSSLALHVNGTLAQTLTAGAGNVSAVRLGSVTSGGSATLEYFDGFTAKRSVTPLIGTAP